MGYASIVLDIPTRALEDAFTYEVPEALAGRVVVGVTVLVTFAGRAAVGYVVGLTDVMPSGLETTRVLPVEQVLAEPAFDETGARMALWLAKEYGSTLSDAVRLLLPPGQRVRVRRSSEDERWELVNKQVGAVDDRWVSLTEEGRSYEPRRNAGRQRALVAALSAGSVRMAELGATMPGIGATITALERKGVVSVEHRRLVRGNDSTSLSSAAAPRPQRLTEGQVEALKVIDDACEVARGDVVLIDGVTGSGKTEVYLQSIERALGRGRGAIVLVPEISLTAQTVGRFRARFGDRVCVLHSGLSTGERFDQWDMVRQGVARVVVGARSALFAPLADPGVIIIDEEHEGSYKQDGAPRYHAREVAAELARLRGCALVLGSATPSLESLGHCERGAWRGVRWNRVVMNERPGGATLPKVRVVDMTAQFGAGGRSLFSAPMVEAIRGVVDRREKAVLLLNRRGFANFLMCRECGCVPECPHCSTSLTYHERTHTLACHTCGRSWAMHAYPDPATCCPSCGSRYMGAYGVGTQRVEDELHALIESFGAAHDSVEIIRMDADTTKLKGAHQRLLERFDSAECAILVGTQMIAKGLDFPEVTLAGVINADTTLKLPDFRASERTYALLEQVAGRSGRGDHPGQVIIQAYWASHPSIRAVEAHDRALFLESELDERSAAGYPPYTRVSNVVVSGTRADVVRSTCETIAALLRDRVGGDSAWEVLGPADCVKARVKDRFRRHVVVKSPTESDVGEVLASCVREAKAPKGVNVAIDVDAHDMM